MKNKLIFIFIILLANSLGFSQNPVSAQRCEISIKDSPALRGIKLGMKKAEAERILGNPIENLEEIKSMSLWFDFTLPSDLEFLREEGDPISAEVLKLYKEGFESIKIQRAYIKLSTFKSANNQFKDVNEIFLQFYNDEIFKMTLAYKTDEFDRLTNEQFYTEVLELLNFPKGIRVFDGKFNCNGFSLTLNKSKGEIRINFSDFLIPKSIEEKTIKALRETYERLKKEEAERKRSFKP